MTNSPLPLVLASGSKGRFNLLRDAGFTVDKVLIPDTDESHLKKETPRNYVLRVAKEKLLAVVPQLDNAVVITADTTVVCGAKFVDKTDDDDVLRQYWKLLSGRRHQVHTGVCCAKIINGVITKIQCKAAVSIVQFVRLTDEEIENYIRSGEGRGKAGGCSILGIAGRYAKFIRGTHTNIVGLPIQLTTQLLKTVGYNLN